MIDIWALTEELAIELDCIVDVGFRYNKRDKLACITVNVECYSKRGHREPSVSLTYRIDLEEFKQKKFDPTWIKKEIIQKFRKRKQG